MLLKSIDVKVKEAHEIKVIKQTKKAHNHHCPSNQ